MLLLKHGDHLQTLSPLTVKIPCASLWLASSVYHTCFYFFFCAHARTHMHRMTDSGNTGSLYLFPPLYSVFSITSLSASLPFIQEQTGTVSFFVSCSVHHWIISLYLFAPSGELAASGPHRIQREGQEGPPEARKGEHQVASVTVSLSKHSDTLFCCDV